MTHEAVLKPSSKAQNSFWVKSCTGEVMGQFQLTKLSRVLEIVWQSTWRWGKTFWAFFCTQKALRGTQRLCAGCSKAEPKIFAPLQTPFPGAQDSQNLISWRWSLPSPSDPVWWRSMHAISSYHGNRPDDPNKPTDRTDYNTLRRS